jgi:hypothetical protein
MAHWGSLGCELSSVILFVALSAWESSRFSLMMQHGLGVGRPVEAHLEARETVFVVI